GQLALAHLLHDLLHLLAREQELIHLLDGRAAAACDSLAPRAVDDMRQRALARRHREDDRLDARQLLLVYIEVAELLAEPGDELEHALERTHPLQHFLRAQEVVERELAGPQ